MTKRLNKGEQLEEVLRIYFLKSGYFVERGVPFKYGAFDITDIDLWMYNRSSSVSREISIVDIKNKRTPQAIERIFWVKGLQSAVKATNAIVATTDKRLDVKDFGKDMGVFVLDGVFLDKIKKYDKHLEHRITNEDFHTMISDYALEKLDGDWKGKMFESKALLAKGLNFDNVNSLIELARFFAQQTITKPSQKNLALRCFYKICSYIAVNIDYLQRELSFLEDAESRRKAFVEGFRYGSSGQKNIKKIVDMSLSFVEQYSENGKTTANQARYNINKQLEDAQTNILAEYFSKHEILQGVFNAALKFESLSMQKNFSSHSESIVEVKSFISVLLDYYSIDRVKFSETIM